MPSQKIARTEGFNFEKICVSGGCSALKPYVCARARIMKVLGHTIFMFYVYDDCMRCTKIDITAPTVHAACFCF